MDCFVLIEDIKRDLKEEEEEEVKIPVPSWMEVDNDEKDPLALTKVKIEEFGGTEELRFPQYIKPDLTLKVEDGLESPSTVLYDCPMTSGEEIQSKKCDMTSHDVVLHLVTKVKDEQPSCSYTSHLKPELEDHTEEFGGTEELHSPQDITTDLVPKVEDGLKLPSTVSEEGNHSMEFGGTEELHSPQDITTDLVPKVEDGLKLPSTVSEEGNHSMEFGGTEELHSPQDITTDLVPKVEDGLKLPSTVSEEGNHSMVSLAKTELGSVPSSSVSAFL